MQNNESVKHKCETQGERWSCYGVFSFKAVTSAAGSSTYADLPIKNQAMEENRERVCIHYGFIGKIKQKRDPVTLKSIFSIHTLSFNFEGGHNLQS